MIRRIFLSVAACLVCLTATSQTHKGKLHLFSDEIKTMTAPIVYDFLERYLYEVSKSSRDYDLYRKMADDKVVVREGSLDNIVRLSPATPFFINRYEDKGYEISWHDEKGRILLCMQFPIQYELLLGKPKVEIEKEFKKEVASQDETFTCCSPTDSLAPLEGETGVFSSTSTSHYFVESLNTATYFWRQDSAMVPIYSANYKAYSAANLFMGVIDNVSDYKLHVEQNLYGFKSKSFIVNLTQWLNYCKANALTIYFGIEEEREDGLKALLIAQNRNLGYNHMLSIILPDNFVEKRDCVLKTVANAYIPTDNIKNLYSERTNK